MQTEEQKHKRELLRNYLVLYRKAENKVDELRNRRLQIINDLRHPLGAQNYSAMPHSNEPGEGAASYSFRLAEIEDRIYSQEKEAKKIMLQVMDVMDFLPLESENRSVLELRYIDGLDDEEIVKRKFYAGRSTVSYHIANGLDELLNFKKIQTIISRYEKKRENINYESY